MPIHFFRLRHTKLIYTNFCSLHPTVSCETNSKGWKFLASWDKVPSRPFLIDCRNLSLHFLSPFLQFFFSKISVYFPVSQVFATYHATFEVSFAKLIGGRILGLVLGRAILPDLCLPAQEDRPMILKMTYLKSR